MIKIKIVLKYIYVSHVLEIYVSHSMINSTSTHIIGHLVIIGTAYT